MRVFKPLFIVVILTLFVSTSVRAQGTTPTGTSAELPAYAVAGSYAVGRSWFMVDKGTPNAVVIVMWYPALKSTSDESGGTLTAPDADHLLNTQETKLIEAGGDWGTSTLNAAPDTTPEPYPLVVYSPGYGESPFNYTNQEEHLASYGFVVMSAIPDDKAAWSHYILRPAIASHVIDVAEGLTNGEGSFKGLIDSKHTGVIGHSSGGYTALALAGAQLDLKWFEGWCADHKDSPDAKGVCPDLLVHEKDMVTLAKLDGMPSELWLSVGDPRVSAIVSQSGDAYVFGPLGLASVTIPVMVQVGVNDTVNTPEWSAYLTYDNVSSAQKSEVVFNSGPADHFIFGGWNSSVATHNLINHFTTAFLLDKLKGDPEAHKALLADAVNFDGIQYKTTLQ
jgi:hypothetical protein